jgi:hypothetical protein
MDQEEQIKADAEALQALRASLRREQERVTQLEQKAAILEAALKAAYRRLAS